MQQHPEGIGQLLYLVKSMRNAENRILALRLVKQLGEEEENWMEVGRQNGFRLLFDLLREDGTQKDLKCEILSTLEEALSRLSSKTRDALSLSLHESVDEGSWRKLSFSIPNWRSLFQVSGFLMRTVERGLTL